MDTLNHKISIQPDHVLIERPPGYEFTADDQPAMLMELSTFCKQAGCRKVLILGSKTKVDLSALDIYELGKEVAKLELQIAIVELHDASDEQVKFLENVAWNRGGPMQFFDTEKEAKDWLEIV